MFDLRFVEREIPSKINEAALSGGTLETYIYRKVKILQWRQCDNPLEVINGLQDAIWTDWTDIRTEEE